MSTHIWSRVTSQDFPGSGEDINLEELTGVDVLFDMGNKSLTFLSHHKD